MSLPSCQEDGSRDFECPLTSIANGEYDHAFSLRNYTLESVTVESLQNTGYLFNRFILNNKMKTC